MRGLLCAAATAVIVCVVGVLAFPDRQPILMADTVAETQATPTVMERISQLPEDGNEYDAYICLHRDWQNRPEEVAIEQGWQQILADVAPNTPVRVWPPFTEDDPVYQERYAFACSGVLPAVFVQRADGLVLYKNTGANILGPTQGVGVDVEAKIGGNKWFRHRLDKQKPAPVTDVKVDTTKAVVPATIPDKVNVAAVEEKKDFNITLGVVLAVVVAVALAIGFRKLVSASPSVS